MRKLVLTLILLTLMFCLYAQEKPRVAVVPFNPVGVSESDAAVITSLFETALVKTEEFDVIEQNQISDIMEAQAYTMTGCTDESCAIEVGKLLAAEQIVLGELSSIGGKFILNAKIIDVQHGKNIRADMVDAADMGAMTDRVELLAFKLAGLTYTTGGSVQVATAFGEAMIETTPPGADIYINGVKKGVSPDLITRIPLGTIRIEARKDNLYAVKEITVSAETARIRLELEEQYGNLFIKSSETDVYVYLDGKGLGALGTGFFDNLSAGDHLLELKGEDIYWSEELTLEPEQSTKVEAFPRELGYLEYRLPDGVAGEVTGPGFRQVVHGQGELKLFAGTYTLEASGPIYIPVKEEISVRRGQRISFNPAMEYTAEHLEKLEKERKDKLYSDLCTGLDDFDEIVHSDMRIRKEDLSAMEDLEGRITGAEFVFPDLAARIRALRGKAADRKELQDDLEEYLARKAELELQISTFDRQTRGKTVGGWISLGAGSASALLSITSFILSWVTYQDYLEAGVDEWSVLKNRYQTWDRVGYISVGTAVLGGGLTPLLWLTLPDEGMRSDAAESLASVLADIDRLEAALRWEEGI